MRPMLECRTNEQVIVNRATLFLMVNDIPKIQPVDDGVRNRVGCVEFRCTFVDNPTGPLERKADPDIKVLLKESLPHQPAFQV